MFSRFSHPEPSRQVKTATATKDYFKSSPKVFIYNSFIPPFSVLPITFITSLSAADYCQTTLQLPVTGHLSLTCFLLSLTQQLCVDCLSVCFLQPFLWFSLSQLLPRSIYLISLSLTSSLYLSAAKISM